MKKLYKKSTVHPTTSVVSEHLLSFLPAAILTLTAALSPADREVLAYLISCSSSANFSGSQRKKAAAGGGGDEHAVCFNCNCFRCYMSYWAKWDSSPNRQLIHEVIDAFEETLQKQQSKKDKNKKERRRVKTVKVCILNEPKCSEVKEDSGFCESNTAAESAGDCGGGTEEEFSGEEEEEFEKGSVRKFVSFLGERLWSVWG